MNKEEILFNEAINLVKKDFFLDAITKFEEIISNKPNSELSDDALYNIGLCYYRMNQIHLSVKYFERVIDEYPNGVISELEGGQEIGSIVAKSLYSLIVCYLRVGDLDKCDSLSHKLKQYPDSYTIIENERISYWSLSQKSIEKYIETFKNEK